MYFSEKRKQGLGSLRPGYFLGGTIGNFLLGNAINYAAPKLFDYATKSKEQREEEKMERDLRKFAHIIMPQGNERDDEETNKTSGFKGALGGGLMNLLATALFGPLVGPLMLTAGRGLKNKIGPLNLSGQTTSSRAQPGKVTTLGGKTVDFGSDEYVADMKARDKAFEETGDYDVYSDTPTSGPTYSPPDPSTYTYEGSDEQDEASNYNGGSDSVSTGNQGPAGGATTSDAGWADDGYWATGGRVSYSKGGLASLWQR